MPNFDNGSNIDFMFNNWWLTVSGAGTGNAVVPSWADDYTRHRSGGLRSTFTSMDSVIGRTDGHSGRELDKGKV